MKLEGIKDIADAVLYEGYILNPSSIENRQRWTFGGIFPQNFAGGDASVMQIQTLVECDAGASLDVHVRFLHIVNRQIARLERPTRTPPAPDAPGMVLVARLEADGRDFLAREEAVEREVTIAGLRPDHLTAAPQVEKFGFAGARTCEWIQTANGDYVGAVIHRSFAIEGRATIGTERLGEKLFRLTVVLENLTPLPDASREDRAKAQGRAFASTHCIAQVHDGDFVSLLDPPEAFRDAAIGCENDGAFPVLVGDEPRREAILASPIILHDYPEVAPESPGDLFDGTEIDEILTLRILALADAEKRDMAAVDARARALLERTHDLSPESFALLHGTMRSPEGPPPIPEFATPPEPRLATWTQDGRAIAVGEKVRLRPRAGGDILDLALQDRLAVVQAIERDFEDRVHVAVTLVDDPGQDFGAAGFPGRRFFFALEEIEPDLGEPE